MEKALRVVFMIAAAVLGVYGINMVSENNTGTEGYIVIACAVFAFWILQSISVEEKSTD